MSKSFHVCAIYLIAIVVACSEVRAQDPNEPLPLIDDIPSDAPATPELLTRSREAIAKSRENFIARIRTEQQNKNSSELFGGGGPYARQVQATYKKSQEETKKAREFFRITVINDLRLQTRHLNDRVSARKIVDQRLIETRKSVDQVLKDLPRTLTDATASFWTLNSQEELSKVTAEAYMNSFYIEYNAVAEFYGGLYGVARLNRSTIGSREPERRSAEPTLVDTSWIVGHMAELADRIVALRPEINDDDDVPDDLEKFLMEAERRVLLEEYKRMAFNAAILNPHTNQPFRPGNRTLLAYGMMENLVEYLKTTDDDPSELMELLGLPMDTRSDFAKVVEAQVPKDYEYKIATLAGSTTEPSPTEYFRILALVLATESYEDIQKYRKDYLGADDSYWNRNLETYARTTKLPTVGLTDIFDRDSRRDAVDKRLQEYLASGDKLAALFDRAAKTDGDPKLLLGEDAKKLEDFGYIIRYQASGGGEEKLVYHIPRSNQGLGEHFRTARKNLALPEASFLSVVSPKEVAIIVAAAAVPEYGATLVANELRAIGASRLMQSIGRFAADRALSAYVDGAVASADYHFDENPNKERFNYNVYSKALLEALILDSANDVAGAFSDKIISSVVQEGATSGGSQQMRAYFKDAAMRDPTFPTKVYEFTRGVLSIAQNTTVQYAYQSLVEDKQLSDRELLMIAFRAALTKGIERSGQSVRNFLASDNTPKWYREAISRDPQLSAETIRNLEIAVKRKEELFARYDRVVEESGDSAESRFGELMEGQFTWEEIKALHAAGRVSPEIQQEVADLRLDHFEEIIHSARIMALAEINRKYGVFLKRAQDSEVETGEAERRAKLRRKREIDLVMAELGAPGSGSPISDIDRNTPSVYLRKHLVGMWVAHQEMRNGGPLTTSARAFDVNEYINVFTFIKENREYVADLKSVTTGPIVRLGETQATPDTDFGDLNLPHDQAMAAIALSGAMREMDAGQRLLYAENLREAIIENAVVAATRTDTVRNMSFADREAYIGNLREQMRRPGELGEPMRQLNQRLAWANGHLGNSEAEIATIIGQNRGERPADHPDVILEAKDQLYQDRMELVNDLQFELSIIEEDGNQRSPEALKIRGRVERLMAIAMRDGIQTYTHTVGLDIIVNRVQDERHAVIGPDGRPVLDENGKNTGHKYTVADRLEQDSFVWSPDHPQLGDYSPPDIEGIIHDQVMFIIEHVNHFNGGVEEPAATGRALGKYVERYFLARKLLGMDINAVRNLPEKHPTRRLLEISQEIVLNKGEPKKILRILTRESSKNPGTPRNGIAEIFHMIEQAIPGMEGMTDLADSGFARAQPTDNPVIKYEIAGKFMAGFVAQALFSFREEKKTVATLQGSKGVVALIDDRLAHISAQVEHLEEQIASLIEITKTYRSKNWELIYRFGPDETMWAGMMASLPWQHAASSTYRTYMAEHGLAEQRMKNLHSGRQMSDDEARGILSADPGTPEFRRLQNRLEFLKRLRSALEEEKREADTKIAEETRYEELRLSGIWTCSDAAKVIGDMTVVHEEPSIIRLTLPYTAADMSQSVLTADALYRRGNIRGIFRDASQVNQMPDGWVGSPTMTSIAFSASTDSTGKKIQFDNKTAEYDGVKITWSAVVCTPKRDDDGDTEFISTTIESLPDTQRENVLAENSGFLKVEAVTPDGEATDEVGHTILLGRQRFTGPWLPPGAYRVLVTLSGKRESLDITIVAGQQTRVSMRAGGLRWRHSGPFVDDVAPSTEIMELLPPNALRFNGQGIESGDYRTALLAPGVYKIAFSIFGGMEVGELAVSPGNWTTVDVVWSGLRLTSNGGAFTVNGVHRRSETASEELQFLASSTTDPSPKSSHDITLAPGGYRISIQRGNDTISQNVDLSAGQVTTIAF